MKKLFLFMLLGTFCLGINAQPTLKFQKGKPFRILQFTDLHYIHGDERSERTIQNIHEMIDTEKPDVVIITGDLIFGKPGYESMKGVLDAVASHNVPFAITYGNHDDEQGLSRYELLEMAKAYPMNLTTTTPGITGVTNYILEVKASESDAPSQLLYMFDSNAYCKIEGSKYDYIHFDQIMWYMNQSREYAKANDGKPLPALAFFHIPLTEYNEALSSGAFFVGIKRETGGESKFNSGLFTASKEMGDIRGFFVGHDHDDDYLVYYKGIALAYGRYSGCNTVYNHVKPNGCRMIEIKEGETSFRTYVRLNGGAITNDVIVPDFFTEKTE
ncbi:MAG: metallophosphoesterase family protein [Bacteroidaceae bacterium]|nr:metallophosphoesterase family protein [Bacteroidaceae bacterium]